MDKIVNRTIANMMRDQDVEGIRAALNITVDSNELQPIDLRKVRPMKTTLMMSMKRKWEASEAQSNIYQILKRPKYTS